MYVVNKIVVSTLDNWTSGTMAQLISTKIDGYPKTIIIVPMFHTNPKTIYRPRLADITTCE